MQYVFCDMTATVRQKTRLPVWVNRVGLTAYRRLPLYPRQRTSSVRPVRSEKCHEATLNPPFQHPLREPIKWKRALTGWSAIKTVAPTEWARPFLGFARIRSANEAVDYFSLITVVLLVPLVLPTVPSSQTLVCLMRSSASTRLLKAIGPICVTTSVSAGRVVVIVQ